MTAPPLEIILTPRPQLAPPRDRYVYFPDTAEVPEQQAVNIRNRSYTIGALVDIPAPGAQGVLFAHGSRFGGHALYVKDNRLHYVNNFVGMIEQKIDGTEDLPVRGEPDPVGLLRQGRRGPARRRHRDPVPVPRRPQGRRRPDQDPAGAVLAWPARACASAGTAASRSPTTTRAITRTLHRRHDQAGRRRRQRRTLRRPRARGPGHARPRVGNENRPGGVSNPGREKWRMPCVLGDEHPAPPTRPPRPPVSTGQG